MKNILFPSLVILGVLYFAFFYEKNEQFKSATVKTSNKKSKKINPETLLGSWQRTDGNYEIKISNLDKDNKTMKAEYFNPRPIHISEANYSYKNENLTMFVKLDDKDYPGCTYTLEYSESQKMLFGEYFQATHHKTYQVFFSKKN